MTGSIISVRDLGAGGIEDVLARAEELRRSRELPSLHGIVALVFLEPSLRTRIGFAAAAARLGISTLEVYEPRSVPASSPESVRDTLRVVAGYTDAIVIRCDDLQALVRDELPVPLLNAGDRAPQAEHPSQALVDLFAIRTILGRPSRHLVVWGDPTMRAAGSLIAALALSGAADRVTVVSNDVFLTRCQLPHGLTVDSLSPTEPLPRDVDVLYVTGMAHASIDLMLREELIVTPAVLQRCPTGAVVLSPMPIIDEISLEARQDPRVRFFQQSDLAVWVRMSLLERLLAAPRDRYNASSGR